MLVHDFDPVTMFCRKCGVAAERVVDGYRDDCTNAENVQGISHIRSAQRLTAKLNVLRLINPRIS